MHWKDARAAGESEERLYTLDAWRESPLYSERERAALALCEAITLISDGQVPDKVWERARAAFDEHELSQLVFAITAINAWNPPHDHGSGGARPLQAGAVRGLASAGAGR